MRKLVLRKTGEVPARTRDKVHDWWIYLALLIATLAVYAQAGGFDFVNLDDPDYVSGNPHVRTGWTAGRREVGVHVAARRPTGFR